jgi:hypothetical protein
MRKMVIISMLLGISTVALADDSYTITHKMEGYATMFKVVAPEGAKCHVKSDSSWFGEKDFEIPFKFKAQKNYYYTFDCKLPDGSKWHKKLEPKGNYTSIIKIGGGSGEAAAPASSAIGSGDFQQLLKSIKDADFEGEKIRVLKMAAKHRYFSSAQIGQLVDAYDFSAGKLKAVELTAARITDPQNSYKILDHFDFDADKQKAQKLLK